VSTTDDVILLAYSGDLEASVALAWLADQHAAELATITLDLGQGTDLSDVRDRALAIGASRAHVLDVREEFARTGVGPALVSGVDEPRVAALARPIVAKYLAQLASIEGTSTVAHGSRLPRSEPSGYESLLTASSPALRVLAPCRDWDLSYREIAEYAGSRGIPAPASAAPYSAIRNLWGRAISGRNGVWAELPNSEYQLTRSVGEWSPTPAILDLEFSEGVPTALNGVAMPLVELLSSLETIVGAHGIGRLDFPAVPGQPRIVEEVPAPLVLHQAMKALAAVVPAMWPEVRGTVRIRCAEGESRVEEVSL